MPTISYSRATVAQLRAFATTNMGLEIEPGTTGPQIRARLAEAGFDGDSIEVEEEAVSKGRQLEPDDIKDRDTVLINIPQQEGVPGGKDAVLVGVNGKVARIQRGVDVRVPAEYVEVLRNAKKIVYGRGENNELNDPQEVPIHPFSVVGR